MLKFEGGHSEGVTCVKALSENLIEQSLDILLPQDKVMAAHPDTWKPWVWAIFAFNTLFGVIFAILSWATFSVSLYAHMLHDSMLYTALAIQLLAHQVSSSLNDHDCKPWHYDAGLQADHAHSDSCAASRNRQQCMVRASSHTFDAVLHWPCISTNCRRLSDSLLIAHRTLSLANCKACRHAPVSVGLCSSCSHKGLSSVKQACSNRHQDALAISER